MKILLDVLPGAEGDAAARSLALRLPLQRGSALQGAPPDVMVVWIHRAPDQGEDLRAAPPEAVAALRARIERGGRVLLTGPAVGLLTALGLEPELPPATASDPGQGPRGVQPFLDHPLFRRSPGGVLLEATPGAGAVPGFGASARPRNGVLTGVEKTDDGLRSERGILLEHRLGAGRVLSLAAHLRFHPDDAFGEHRLRFAGDLIDYLLSDGRAAAAPPWPAGVARVELVDAWPLPELSGPLVGEAWSPELADLRSARGSWSGMATSAGLLWQESEGVGEAWFKGVRILRDLRARIVSGDRELPFPGGEPEHAQAPGFLWRQPTGGAGATACAVAGAEGALMFHWTSSDPKAQLELHGVLEHALEAPWPPSSLAPLRVHQAPDGRGLLWQEGVLGRAALLRTSAAPSLLEGAIVTDLGEAGYRFRLRIPLRERIVVSLRAADRMVELAAPGAAPTEEPLVRLSVDDPGRDQELAFCVHNLRECILPMRTGERVLLAGFGAPAPVLLGAEALWAVEPLLWLGARDAVRETLRLLVRHVDPSGRMPHSVSWSGTPRCGALEPSLVFPSALGAWLDVTGDLELPRASWAALKRVIRLFEELDRDGDGVPELMDAGSSLLIRVDQLALLVHGLRAAARVAEALGERNPALTWSAWSEQLHSRLTSACFDAELGTYALGIGGQGVPERVLAPTCAVPVALGLCDPASAALALVPFEGPEQALPFGVRHGPAGPAARQALAHETALLALAEFRAGRPDAAWSWLSALLAQVRSFAPAGIARGVALPAVPDRDCVRDARGHALAIGAAVQGMLGAAAVGGLAFAPALPVQVARLTFSGLRYRGHVLAGELARGAEGADLLLTLRKDDDAPLPVQVAPFFGRGWQPSAVLEDGVEREFHLVRLGEGARAMVRAELARELRLLFRTEAVAVPETVTDPASAMRFVGGPMVPVADRPPAAQPPASSTEQLPSAPQPEADAEPEPQPEPDTHQGEAPPAQARSAEPIRMMVAVPEAALPEVLPEAPPLLLEPESPACPAPESSALCVPAVVLPEPAVVAGPALESAPPLVPDAAVVESELPAVLPELPAILAAPQAPPPLAVPVAEPATLAAPGSEPPVTGTAPVAEPGVSATPPLAEPVLPPDPAPDSAERNGTHGFVAAAPPGSVAPLPELAPEPQAPAPTARVAPLPPRTRPGSSSNRPKAAPAGAPVKRPAAPRPAAAPERRPAARRPAPARRPQQTSQAVLVGVIIALFTGGGLFVFLQGVPTEARERELTVAVAPLPGVSAQPTPTRPPAPDSGTPAVASADTSGVAPVPVPGGLVTLELASLIELLGPPGEGSLPEDGRCAFRLHDGSLLEGQVEGGELRALRVVPPLARP